MDAIEDMLVQWSASGRIDGGVAPRPGHQCSAWPPMVPLNTTISATVALEAAHTKAKLTSKRAEQLLRTARTEQITAARALEAAEQMGGKKKKGPPPELIEAVAACEQAVTKRRAQIEAAREAEKRAKDALDVAKAEEAARAKKIELAALDTRLRTLHMEVTHRHLPCRVPHLLSAADEQVKQQPESTLLAFDDLRRLLATLGIGSTDVRALRVLWMLLEREERCAHPQTADEGADSSPQAGQPPSHSPPAQHVSLAALRRHCGIEESLVPLAPRREPMIAPSGVMADAMHGTAPAASRPPPVRARPASAALVRSNAVPGHRPPPRPASGLLRPPR